MDAIGQTVDAAERRAQSTGDAVAARNQALASNRSIPAPEVHDYLRDKVHGKSGTRPNAPGMARIIYSQNALDDLDRLTDFPLENVPDDAPQTADLIIEAVNTLAHNPLIGRPVEYDLRELLISRGRSGYVTFYSLEQEGNIALILAIRHQREVGYD